MASRRRWSIRTPGGVLLCGTPRLALRANGHAGVRVAVAGSPDVVRLAREHDNANVLILPARFVSADEGVAILRIWLDTELKVAVTSAGSRKLTRSLHEPRP